MAEFVFGKATGEEQIIAEAKAALRHEKFREAILDAMSGAKRELRGRMDQGRNETIGAPVYLREGKFYVGNAGPYEAKGRRRASDDFGGLDREPVNIDNDCKILVITEVPWKGIGNGYLKNEGIADYYRRLSADVGVPILVRGLEDYRKAIIYSDKLKDSYLEVKITKDFKLILESSKKQTKT